ncbi:MAG TPA: sigma-70 family RNA polymerase sigma factor [Tepidisphaeraceae bacterium]|jgi:RNA polymerase sigma factor for flagellar operon FliA
MDAFEELVVQHQDYVRSLARAIAKKLPKNVEFEELVAMGQLGLTSAARQYEPGRGVAFTTFAYYRIRGAIFDGLRQMTWLPPAMRRKLARLDGENEVSELTAESAEVSDDPEFLAKQFQTAVGRLGAVFLASGASNEDSDKEDPTDGRSAADEAESREDLTHLTEALAKLPEDQSALIRMLYFEYRSMTDVANELKKNKSTISRRHAEALDALRAALAA